MSTPDGYGRSRHSRDETFAAFAVETRREALRIVNERSPTGVTKHELAAELAARTTAGDATAVTDADRQRLLVDCHHRTLPALFDAGLLEKTDDGRLVTTAHWAFDDAGLGAVLDDQTTDHRVDLDVLFEALSDSRRRTVLSVLDGSHQPHSTEALARAVAASEMDRDIRRDEVEQVWSTLRHVHLPVLNDAGLVGYDAESSLVSYEGHPVLHESWLEGTHEQPSQANARGRSLNAVTGVLRSGSNR
ncbi:DUF7344 domain-containing protein [Natronorubrum sulfidifaciens]|uniref:DUF7344 domain-containing protein n=1 Tax=Natronorubrum sulfidifaciens JCM 14089 TaxID=1230460 RepID=L9VZ92_9EURY|nr:hypothetical protein [Natronorubrum sulfidifaciens]ELY42377.1 hypothetical protein C495_15272 [Natronorubrum sulfidifaciens JCM 14089]